MKLSQKKCQPCEGGNKALSEFETRENLKKLKNPWELKEGVKIRHTFHFKTFTEAINFINRVAQLAEQERHHPDMHISYNKVRIDLQTHAIKGLSENDFILASKIETL